MKLNGKTTVEVEIRPIDALKSLRNEVFSKLGLDMNCYFDSTTNYVYLESCEYYGSHKSYETMIVVCTDQQREIVKAFQTLDEYFFRLDQG